jgi:hypothetical protein
LGPETLNFSVPKPKPKLKNIFIDIIQRKHKDQVITVHDEKI